jgi:tripartite-type tricarboxylate transporter receptor subunit TctC
MIRQSTIAAVAVCLTLVLAAAAPASADSYPSHPITMIVPLAPGGSTDVLGRIMAQAMSARLGQPVIVENVAGAAGTSGVTRAERSAPDGYTVLWGMWGTNVANGAIYKLPFDLLNDFQPIALVATQPFLIDARKTIPANNLKELVAWLKANGDKTTMGTSGVGSPSHVAGVLMENILGLHWQMVAYRSAGLATNDLLAGITDIQLDTPAVSLPHVKSGAIKPTR